MDLKELRRRDVIRLSSLGAVGLMISPGRAFAQTKPLFRLDEQNSIHFLAGHFIPQFLTLPVEWEVKQFATSGQGRVSAFARGAIDCITTSWTYLAQMAFNDLPGTCVTGMAGGGSRVLVPRGSSIKTWEDLRGKSVGVVEYSFQDISFIYALKKKGIDPFKDLKRVNLGSPAGVVAAMSGGQVDACAIFEPYGSILMVERGAVMISNLSDDAFGITNGGMFVHNDFIKKYPEMTQDIVSATVKATEFVATHRDAWIDRAREVTGQSQEVATLAVDNCTPSIDIPATTIRGIAKAMYELGIQNRDVTDDLNHYIDYTYLEKATGKTKDQLGYLA
jgi:ABC-type nitrate/sulfonate/bicarbonate transport system substrate-binding protein